MLASLRPEVSSALQSMSMVFVDGSLYSAHVPDRPAFVGPFRMGDANRPSFELCDGIQDGFSEPDGSGANTPSFGGAANRPPFELCDGMQDGFSAPDGADAVRASLERYDEMQDGFG